MKASFKPLAAFPPDMSKKVTSQLKPHAHADHRFIPNWPPLLSPRRVEVQARFTSPMTQFLLSAPEQARAMGGRPTRAQRQKPILSSKQVSDQRNGRIEGGRQTHKTSGTIEKNLDNGHLRNSSRGREGACAVERGINQEEELVASIQPSGIHRRAMRPSLSLPSSFH